MKNHIFLTCLIKSIQFHNSHARNSAFLKSNTLTHNFKNNYDGYLSYTRSGCKGFNETGLPVFGWCF